MAEQRRTSLHGRGWWVQTRWYLAICPPVALALQSLPIVLSPEHWAARERCMSATCSLPPHDVKRSEVACGQFGEGEREKWGGVHEGALTRVTEPGQRGISRGKSRNPSLPHIPDGQHSCCGSLQNSDVGGWVGGG